MVRIRKVRTASGATAVQIVRDVDRHTVVDYHVGSAHNDVELAALMVKAEALMAPGQLALEFPDTSQPDSSSQLTVGSMPARILFDVLTLAWTRLGFDAVCPADSTFGQVVMARIIQPSSKSKVPAILNRLGKHSPHRNTVSAAVKKAFDLDYRHGLATACFTFSHARGTVSWVLYDVTTLYFEADREDELRKVGYSKERRIDPQIVVGLLVDHRGMPLEIGCFEGNKAETHTMAEVLSGFTKRHQLDNIIVVADAGMISADNCNKLSDLGFQFIVGSKMSKAPFGMDMTVNDTGEGITDGHIVEDSKIMGKAKETKTRRRMVCHYSKKRFHNDKHNLDKQYDRAQAIVEGTRKQKQARFVTQSKASQVFNQKDYDKACKLAGWKGYVTNIKAEDMAGADIVAKYHDLYEVERSFRMAKSDLQARPMYVREKDSIEAHLTVVFAALALSRYLQDVTGFSRQKIIDTLEPLRDVIINTPHGPLTIPATITPEAAEILTQMSY